MAEVRRGYVDVDGRAVHYRTCGRGPAVVMLHDSPRSSRLHLPTMAALAGHFTIFALDTPGYGNSAPLAPEPNRDLTIPDFASALGRTLAALGLEAAPVYATHTSAKIALALAARAGTMPRLVLDGLSLPEKLASPEFIAAYMRPFAIDDDGAYLAAEWSRTRDMVRWFPWFARSAAARTAMAAPSPEWLADYAIDLFSAGPDYADAYAAAMRWDPMPDLLSVTVPTIVGARSDDVLFGFLDRVPADANPALTVQRLGTDRGEWLAWLHGSLGATDASLPPPTPRATADRGYLDLAHGQLHWQRLGRGEPVLVLSAPTTLQAHGWARALAGSHCSIVPDLPGFGESDPLPAADADAIADALAALLAELAGGPATVLGIGIASPLAGRLAARHPALVNRLVIDGAPPLEGGAAERFGAGLCPSVTYDPHAGTHLHRIWHLLRDGEVQWPWHDPSAGAVRRLPPQLGGEALHDALTGVLKQPRDWGLAAQAALVAGRSEDWARVEVPTTVFAHADPSHGESATIAAVIRGAGLVSRPDTLDDAARLLARKEG